MFEDFLRLLQQVSHIYRILLINASNKFHHENCARACYVVSTVVFLRCLNIILRFRSNDKQAISTRILLSPHLQASIDKAKKHTDELFIDASVCLADSLIHTVGGTDYHRVQILELAHEAQKKLGLRNFCACRLLTDLGYSYREAGKLDKVIPVLEEAMSIVEQFQGIYVVKLQYF